MENIFPPILMIFAGPNGSGKTTFYEAIKAQNSNQDDIALVNPDVIAKQMANDLNFANVNELPKELKTRVDIGAARSAIEYRDKLIEEKQSLIIETTASASSILKLMDKAQGLGYKVIVNYLMLQHPQLNISRIAARVKKGAHYVEPEIVCRRYYKARDLIADICIHADQFNLYDNSGKKPAKLITKHENKIFVLKQDNPITKHVCAQLQDKNINMYSLKQEQER